MIKSARSRSGLAMSFQTWWLSLLHRVVARDPFPGRGFMERASVRLTRGPSLVRVRPGYRIHLDLADDYERQIFLGGYEEPLLEFVRRALREGDLFVDGGTNVGVHMLNAAVAVGRTGRVLAFEPVEDVFERAAANLEQNPELGPRISLKRAALSDHPGTVQMAHAGDRHLESRVVAGEGNVSCTTLDAELSPADLAEGRIVVCKLDVEGYEQRVLDGARRLLEREGTIFICELNDPLLRLNGTSAPDLIERLRSAGYVAWTDHGDLLTAYDPSWPPFLNGVFARDARARARVAAAFAGRVR